MNTGIDPAENARTIENAVAEASNAGAEILFTPEMSNMLDRDRKRASNTIAMQDDDPVLARTRTAAREYGISVALGSCALKHADGKWRNRSFVIDANGEIAAYYDKIHLFDVTLGNGDDWRESSVYAGGDTAVIADVAGQKLGLSICYDIRFSQLYRKLAQAGAHIITIPAAFTVPTGKAHWEILLRARAIETQSYIVAAAQVGHHADGRDTYGHSMVVNPWGEIVHDMGGEAPGVAIVTLDMDRLHDIRAKLPSLANARQIADTVRT